MNFGKAEFMRSTKLVKNGRLLKAESQLHPGEYYVYWLLSSKSGKTYWKCRGCQQAGMTVDGMMFTKA